MPNILLQGTINIKIINEGFYIFFVLSSNSVVFFFTCDAFQLRLAQLKYYQRQWLLTVMLNNTSYRK